jgi:hypothetical protein
MKINQIWNKILAPIKISKKFQNLKFQYIKLNNKKIILKIKYSLKNSAATKEFKMS